MLVVKDAAEMVSGKVVPVIVFVVLAAVIIYPEMLK